MVCSALADRPLDFNADVVRMKSEVRSREIRKKAEIRNPKSRK